MPTTAKDPTSPQHRLPRGTPSTRNEDCESRFWRWLPWIFVVLLLIALPVGIWMTARAGEDRARADQTQVALDSTAAQASSLADQIKAECDAGRLAGPVCQQAAEVQQTPVPVPAPIQGERGADGARGPMGPQGRPGQDPPCLTEPAECRGADGTDGTDGQDGTDGADGKDGQDGTDGAPGRDGSPAQTFVVNGADGSVMNCVRSGGEDTAPIYDCTYTTPPPEGP